MSSLLKDEQGSQLKRKPKRTYPQQNFFTSPESESASAPAPYPPPHSHFIVTSAAAVAAPEESSLASSSSSSSSLSSSSASSSSSSSDSDSEESESTPRRRRRRKYIYSSSSNNNSNSKIPTPLASLGGKDASRPTTYITCPVPMRTPYKVAAPGTALLPPPPPSVRPNVVCKDTGNCNPRFLRLSMYAVPADKAMAAKVGLPFGAIVAPLADLGQNDDTVAVVNPGTPSGEPTSCPKCVPKSFVGNITQRPELVKGSFEYILAQPDPARSPIVCFVLDISSAAVSNGSLTLIASTLQQVLVPGSGATVSRVAFVTYDSRSIHFWDISATQKRPRMLVVTAAIDGDICIPGLLSTDVAQCSPSLSFFLTHLNDFAEHANPHSSQSQSLPPLEHAICAATQLIKAHKVGGRVVAFSSAAPTASREADVPLAPLSTAYRTLGKACARDGVGVDLFLFAPASQLARRHQDVATLGEVARVTGGQLYRYDSINNGFGWAFSADLRRNLSRTWGCSATLQVRASKGVFSAEYLGNFIPVGTGKGRCASFATIDADKAIGVVFSHGSGTLSGHVMFQAALLYTSAPNGALCLRVHTVAVPSTAAIPAVFRSCDCDAMVGLTARLAVDAMRWSGKPPAQAGKDVVATTVEAFAAYRAACTRMPAAGQLVLPDSLSLLPLYISCLLKSPLLAPAGAVSADMRSVAMATTGANTLPSTLTSLYPRAYFLDSILPPSSPQQQQQKLSMTSSVTSNDDVSNDVSGNKNAYLYVFPRAVRLNLDAYLPDGVYLLDSGGPTVLIFVGESPDPDVAEHLFGTRDVAAIPAHTLTEAFSERLQQWTVDAAAAATAAGPGELAARFPMLALVQELARVRGHSCFGFRVVRDVDVRSDLTLMSQVYAEDSMKSCLSYSEFLCQLHDKIIQKLSHT